VALRDRVVAALGVALVTALGTWLVYTTHENARGGGVTDRRLTTAEERLRVHAEYLQFLTTLGLHYKDAINALQAEHGIDALDWSKIDARPPAMPLNDGPASTPTGPLP